MKHPHHVFLALALGAMASVAIVPFLLPPDPTPGETSGATPAPVAPPVAPAPAPEAPYRVPQEISCREHAQTAPPKEEDLLGFDRELMIYTPRSLGANDAPASFMLIGDSHAWHLAHGLSECCNEAGMRGLYLNDNSLPAWGCTSILNDGKEIWDESRTHALLRWIAAQKDVRCVVICERWEKRLGVDNARSWDGTPIPYTEAPERLRQGLVEFCRRVRALGKEVAVLQDTPCFPDSENPNKDAELCHQRHEEMPWHTTNREHYTEANREAAPLFRMLQAEGLAHIIETAPALEQDGLYPFRDADGRFLYRDNSHLSALGSSRVARYIFPALRQFAK